MTSTQSTPTASNEVNEIIAAFRKEMTSRIVGQEEMIDGLLTALIAGGHILLEGMPGLAKTLAVKTLAAATGLAFKRIQFTPDLLPADLTGTLVWQQGAASASAFVFRKGPVFANIVLADEINRAPAKVQSALLEAMEERQVTIGEETRPLPDPFFVMATQNPIEHEGTYPLPEAELDRFLLKLKVRYPSAEEELRIVTAEGESYWNSTEATADSKSAPVVLDKAALRSLQEAAKAIHVDQTLSRYIVSIVQATRPPASVQQAASPGAPFTAQAFPKTAAAFAGGSVYRYISFGASPRGAIAMYRCAKIQALLSGRDFVTPEDVKTAALPALRHRLVLSYEAEADGLEADAVISRILSLVPAP